MFINICKNNFCNTYCISICVITKTPETNTAPVARDVTTGVNENASSAYDDVAIPSDDADGDISPSASSEGIATSSYADDAFSLTPVVTSLATGAVFVSGVFVMTQMEIQ